MKANTQFINTLKQSLKSSTLQQRTLWIAQIVDEEIDIKELCDLFLYEDRTTALRFSWFLSEIGMYKSTDLLAVLPYLFERRKQTSIKGFTYSFVKYWRIAGVPQENKGDAINLLFDWLIDPATSVSVKTHAMEVLFGLTKEFPDLKNELITCIEDQVDKTKVSFGIKAKEILKALKKDIY